MKKIILIFSILLISLNSIAQNDFLEGKWCFDSIVSNDEMDEQSKQMIQMVLKNMYLAFNSDKYEQSIMNKVERGNWLTDEDGTYFISSLGYEYLVSINKKSDSLIIFNHNDMSIQLKKYTDYYEIENFVNNLDKVEGIEIDSNLIVGIWNNTGTVKKDGTEFPAIKHSKKEPTSYNFKSDGIFENKAPLGIELFAYWSISEDLQYIILQSEEKNEYFKILKLDDKFLEIYNPKNESIVKFEKNK